MDVSKVLLGNLILPSSPASYDSSLPLTSFPSLFAQHIFLLVNFRSGITCSGKCDCCGELFRCDEYQQISFIKFDVRKKRKKERKKEETSPHCRVSIPHGAFLHQFILEKIRRHEEEGGEAEGRLVSKACKIIFSSCESLEN